MIITKYQIHEGYVIPWWLGLAYWEWNRPVAVCYLIPFNLAVRWSRNIYFWVKATHRPDWMAAQLQNAYVDGRNSIRNLYAHSNDEPNL